MFVHYLDERQQAVLLHYARELMVADGAIDPEEGLHMEVLRTQMRPGTQSEAAPLEQLASLFSDKPSKIILLLELIGMGYANDEFAAQESELIKNVARALSVTETDALYKWAYRQLLLLKEAQELMEV